MEMDSARHGAIGLVSALLVLALLTWGGKGPPEQKGWRHLQPGGTYVLGIGLGMLLTIGMAWVWLFVGSDRPDSESQMRILFWLILAFGAGTLMTLLQYRQTRKSAVRWRGDTLRWRGRDGAERSGTLGEAVALRRAFMGPVHVVFADGAEARIDPYARHADLLIERVEVTLHPDRSTPS